jgi:hypothetical protein
MELIGIRECARRLGVSDTAVRKAITAGRVAIAGRTESSNRPLVAWPQAADDWNRNSDATKRTHYGGTGASPARARYDTAPAEVALPTRNQVLGIETPPAVPAQAPQQDFQAEPDTPAARVATGPSLAQSKAVREAYMARLARLDFEERSGKLVSADEVKVRWFKRIKAAQTRILGIPAACKSRAADLPLAVVAMIDSVCREALEDLANARD